MDENLQNIENLFGDALKDNDEKPSQSVWNALEKRLDQDRINNLKIKYNKLKKLSVILMLLLGLSVYVINKNLIFKRSLPSGIIQTNNKNPGSVDGKIRKEEKGNNTPSFIDSSGIEKNSNKVAISQKTISEVNKKAGSQSDKIFNKAQPQKQNSNPTLFSEENNVNTKSIVTTLKNKKLSTGSRAKTNIKNVLPSENETYIPKEENNSDNINLFFFGNLENLPIENTLSPLKDFIKVNRVNPKIESGEKYLSKAVQKSNKKDYGLSIMPFFSPDFAWYYLQDDEVGNQPDNANQLEKEEKHQFSSTYGILVVKSLNSHWGIQSGITISNTNITLEPKIIYAQPDNTGAVKYRINTSSGYGFVLPPFSQNPVIGDSLYMYTSVHSLQYIGIPLEGGYSMKKGKFRINLSAGISVNILSKANIKVNLENGINETTETINKLQGIRQLNFSGLTSAGIDYQLSKKLSISFIPTYRFALNSIDINATVKSYPKTFGSWIGLKINLSNSNQRAAAEY
jgi:hypothetical protein